MVFERLLLSRSLSGEKPSEVRLSGPRMSENTMPFLFTLSEYRLQYISAQVLVLNDIGQFFPDICPVDIEFCMRLLRRLEGNVLKELFEYSMQPSGAYVLSFIVHKCRDLGDLVDRIIREIDLYVLCGEERGILPDQCVMGFNQDPFEFVLAERVELDTYREPALKFRYQV